jgi:hypothetical protein
MIIQCPDCGYAGRIPDSALGGSHLATCPRCRIRFSLHVTPAGPGGNDPGGLAIPDEEEVDQNGPGSSSYELRAISDDDEDTRDGHSDEFNAEIRRAGSNLLALPGPASSDFPEAPTQAAGTSFPAALQPVVESEGTDPWYAPILQLWGIVLMVWAALVLGRDLPALFLPSERATSNGQVVWTVISVLLLVAGAAGLFVAVDFGRSLRAGLKSPVSRPGRWRRLFPLALTARWRRPWHRPPRRPQPVRP